MDFISFNCEFVDINVDLFLDLMYECKIYFWLWEVLTPKFSCSGNILLDQVFLVSSEEALLQDLNCLNLLNP